MEVGDGRGPPITDHHDRPEAGLSNGPAGTCPNHDQRSRDHHPGRPSINRGGAESNPHGNPSASGHGRDRPPVDHQFGRAEANAGHERTEVGDGRGPPITDDRHNRPEAGLSSGPAGTCPDHDQRSRDHRPGRPSSNRGGAESNSHGSPSASGHGRDRLAVDHQFGRAESNASHERTEVGDGRGPPITDHRDRPEAGLSNGPAGTGFGGALAVPEGRRSPEAGQAGHLPETFFQKVAGSHYPLAVLLLSLQWVREGNSLRGVSRLWETWMRQLGLPWWGPHPTTIRLWVLRYGHWELNRPKEKADDWIWVIDHSAQFGVLKCFLILGIRQSQVPSRPLGLQDMTLLKLQPVGRSNGAIVEGQLQDQAEETGVALAIVRDEGSDLRVGTRQFKAEHPQTAVVYDVKHCTARLLKRHLEADAEWGEFTSACSQLRPQLQQTPWAFLAPPSGRAHKSRWMNVGELIGWGVETLEIVRHPPSALLRYVDASGLRDKLGWLESYAPALVRWQALEAVTRHTVEVVREEGFHAGTLEVWEAGLVGLPTGPNMGPVQAELRTYLQGESDKAGAGCIPGTTEVIESSFAKLKATEQQQSRSGLTGLILGLGSLLGAATADTVRQAFASTPVSAVCRWCAEWIGASVQAQRRAAYQAVRKRNKNGTNPDP